MEKTIFNQKIFEFVSLIKYNGEKRSFIELALKKFLANPSENFNIEEEIKKIYKNKEPFKKDREINNLGNIFSPEELFESQDYILSIDADIGDLLFYLFEKYAPYDNNLIEEIGISVTDIINFCILLQNIYHIDLLGGNYNSNPNVFSSLEEMYYPYKLQKPEENDSKTSEMASLISKDALILFIQNVVAKEKVEHIIKNLDKFLNLISFDIKDFQNDNKLRFQDKPLLKIDNETYVIINEVHLINGLNLRLDALLNPYSWYQNKKGKNFENIVFQVLEEGINNHKKVKGHFNKDIPFDGGQLDGLITFEDMSWFIECKSRTPRSDSYKGKTNSVLNDLERGVVEAEDQALKAINKSLDSNKIGDISIKSKKGVLIIVEGIYPNLNQNPITKFERKNTKYPRYIISIFTLMQILRQHDVYYLDKFLDWRSDPEMPIYSMSELDYWDYFTQMQSGLDKKEAYDSAKKKFIRVIYTGKRFNAPKYFKGD